MIGDFYSDLVFRYYNGEEDGFLLTRHLTKRGGKNRYFTSIPDLIHDIDGAPDAFHGVGVHSSRDAKSASIAFSSCIYIDIDIYKTFGSWACYEERRKDVLRALMNDYMLSQLSAVVDTGGGIHVYYLFPAKQYKDTYSRMLSAMREYLSGIATIKKLYDPAVYDLARIMRAPGSVNTKYERNPTCEILHLKPEPINGDFMKMLTSDRKKDRSTSGGSVARAFELLGMQHLLVDNTNINCPFPGHNDERASFRYYSDSDTYYCFKCKNGWDGVHFLKAMNREDMIPQLKADADISFRSKYTLETDGSLFKVGKEKNTLICGFGSNLKIETHNPICGRRVYVVLGDEAIEIGDFPTNRLLKRRYLQAGRSFLLESADSKLSDHIQRFVDMASVSDKEVLSFPGLNMNGDGVKFLLNGIAYPKPDRGFLTISSEFFTERVRYDSDFDIDTFLENLIKDGNWTHVVAFLWGVASVARDIVVRRSGLFPMLVATGIRESGKTLLGKLVCSMFCHDKSEEMDTTSFAFIKKIERYGTIPMHIDEFSNKNREKEHDEMLKDIATSVFHCRERGNIDKGTDKYFLQCPIIITGEKHVIDAGLVSRSIILNLGRNIHPEDQGYFNAWVNDVLDMRPYSFMHDFLSADFENFRAYMGKVSLSRTRNTAKRDIIFSTLDFLCMNNYIRGDLIDRNALERIFRDVDDYKANIAPDSYTEIMDECFSDDFQWLNMREYAADHGIQEMKDTVYFNTEDNYVILNVGRLYNYYHSIRHNRNKISSQRLFRTALAQSPDALVTGMTRKSIRVYTNLAEDEWMIKRPSFSIMIRISGLNFNFLLLPLLYKLRPYYTSHEKLYRDATAILEKMRNSEPAFDKRLKRNYIFL